LCFLYLVGFVQFSFNVCVDEWAVCDFTAAAAAALGTTSKTEEVEIQEDTYLSIIAGGPAKDPIAAQPDLSR
jgi:hypothetical protein